MEKELLKVLKKDNDKLAFVFMVELSIENPDSKTLKTLVIDTLKWDKFISKEKDKITRDDIRNSKCNILALRDVLKRELGKLDDIISTCGINNKAVVMK